jgi:hypothetical protein
VSLRLQNERGKRMNVSSPDHTGKYLKIMDRSGNVWFQGKAVERVGDGYRFTTLKVGGRALEVEVIARVDELAGAALACA